MSDSEKKISDLTEEVSKLTTLVKDLSGTTVKTKRETLIKDALKKADLSEGFLSYITVDKDEDIEENVKNLKDEILGLKQAEIDKKLKGGEIPPKGEAAGDLEEELVGEVASGEEGTSGDFKGKELIEEEKNN